MSIQVRPAANRKLTFFSNLRPIGQRRLHIPANEGRALFDWWKNLTLQARFMLITSIGLLGVAVCIMTLVAWFETAKVEEKLRDASESELGSLNALVSSAMEQRMADSKDVAITVFNRWFEHRNADYSGNLWSVWSPALIAEVAKAAAEQIDGFGDETARKPPPAKPPRDALD
jgi:ABC-type protease/lipase transport system fused ATPase/permease subunit